MAEDALVALGRLYSKCYGRVGLASMHTCYDPINVCIGTVTIERITERDGEREMHQCFLTW